MGIADWLGIGKTVGEVADKAANGAVNLVAVAKGDLTPEVKGKIELLKTEIAGDVEKIVQNSVDKAREFALEYEGRADQVPKWLLLVRALIRPVVTIYAFGWFFAALTVDIINKMQRTPDYELILNELPEGFWWILGTVALFWFGGKAIERTAEKIKDKPSS